MSMRIWRDCDLESNKIKLRTAIRLDSPRPEMFIGWKPLNILDKQNQKLEKFMVALSQKVK
jgi:hypothetical protein